MFFVNLSYLVNIAKIWPNLLKERDCHTSSSAWAKPSCARLPDFLSFWLKSFLWRTTTLGLWLNLLLVEDCHTLLQLWLKSFLWRTTTLWLWLVEDCHTASALPKSFLWRTTTLRLWLNLLLVNDCRTSLALAKSFFQRTTTLRLRLNLLDAGSPILSWLHCRIGEKENQ